MRISITSGNGFVYTETIQRIQEASSKPVSNSSQDTSANKEDFDKLLKDIQAQIQKATTSSVSNINMNSATVGNSQGVSNKASSSVSVVTSSENTASTDVNNAATSSGAINVNVTKPGYESIAPDNLEDIYKRASQTYGIDQKLLELIGYHESRFQANATSRSGAMGIMQLMPATAQGLGVTDAYDPEQNIMGAAKLLRNLSDAYNGDLDLILSGYSAGMGAVRKYGGVPPYEETTNYIAWIRERYP